MTLVRSLLTEPHNGIGINLRRVNPYGSMMHVRYTSHFLLAAFLWLIPAGLSAQAISFSAEATPQRLGLKDALQITYTLENADDIESLEPAPSKDFSVVGGPMDSRGSSISIVNGKRTQRTTFSRTYVLRPKRTGTLRAPEGIARTMDGKTYRSNAQTVEVVKGSVAPQQRAVPRQDPFFSDPFFQSPFATPPPAPEPPTKKIWNPQPGRDLFIRASVSKPRAYVGEAVVVSYRLYSRVTVQAQLTRLPQAAGAWTEEIPSGEPTPRDETVNGQPYRSVLIKQLLMYPQQPGTLVLPEAEAEGYAHPPGEDLSGFGSLLGDASMGGVPVRLRTGAVSLTVVPLPETGKPANFGGAVGKLSLDAELDGSTITEDGSATLTLTLRGTGAGRLTPVPRPVFPSGLDAYEPMVRDSVLADGTGVKTVQYTIASREAGTYTIPAISFAYYDPQQQVYRTMITKPLALTVREGSGRKSIAAVTNPAKQGWLGNAMLAVGLAGLAGAVVYFILRKKRLPKPHTPAPAIAATQTNAATVVVAPPPAPVLVLDTAPTHAELLRLFRQCLSDLLDLPVSSVSKATVLRAMDAQGVPDAVQATVHHVWQECEAAVYAPGGLGSAQTVRETAQTAEAVLEQLRLGLAA